MRTITFIIIGAVLLTIHPIKAQPDQKEKLYYDKIRIGLTSVLSNEKIYFFGGEIFNEIDSTSTISKEFFTLDVSSLELHKSNPLNNSMFKGKWELLDSTEKVHGLKNHVMALSNHGNDSTIIFLEGEPLILDTREGPSRIYEYDIDQGKWVINPKYHGTLPPQRLSFASVTQNMEDGIIYLFGGIFNPNSKGKGRVNNQLYSIDTKDKRWDVLPVKNLPPGVFGSTCNLMKDGKIVFIGGAYFHPSNKVKLSRMNNLNVYDTINNRWSLRTIFDKDSPEGRFGHTATLHGNEIIIVGGKNVENQKASNPYLICLNLDEWSWKHQDVGQAYYDGFARFGHNAILLGDYLFITFGRGVNKVKEVHPIEIINTKSLERIVQQPTNSDQVVTIQSEPTFAPPGESDVNNNDGGDDDNYPEESDLKGSDGESSNRNQSIIIILSVIGGITLVLSFLVAFLIFYVTKHLKFTNPDNGRTRQSTRSINYLSILTRNTQPNQENSKNPDEISLFNLSQSPSPTGVNKTIDDTLSIDVIQSPSTTYLKTIATIEKTPTVIYASGVPSISADISFASPNQ